MLNFVCEARTLSSTVSLVARAAADKDVLPALTGVQIRAEGHELALSATDLEIGIAARIPADVRSEGSLLLPARRLQELLRRVPAEELVEVRAIEGTASLRFGRSRFDLVTLAEADYPAVQFDVDLARGVRLPLQELRKAVSRVAYAVSTREDSLQVLLGISLRLEPNAVELSASDNFRLAWYRITGVPGPSEPTEVILRGRTLSELLRLVDTEQVTISVGERRVDLAMADVRAFVQRIEGKFPDHRQLLQRDFPTHYRFRVAELLAACERAELVADPHNPQVILKLTPGEGLLLRSSAAELGQAQEEVSGEVRGQPLECGFNPRYLIDALRNLGSEEAEFAFSGATSAATLRPIERPDDQLAILLPLRLW